MKEVVDLYAKLVIGTFSFMGPSFTLLISLFYKAIEKSKQKHSSKMKNLKEAISKPLSQDEDFSRQIAITNRQLKKLERTNKTELNLLSPKRQVVRLFTCLLIAIFFIELYYFQNTHFWRIKNEEYRGTSLAVSFIKFYV